MSSAPLASTLPKATATFDVAALSSAKPEALAQQAAGDVAAQVQSQLAESSLGPVMVWAGVALAVVLAVVAAFLVWRKAKSTGKDAKPAAASPKGPPTPDPFDDFLKFRNELPRDLRRALDDFQVVIVFGNAASEKELLIRECSQAASREQLDGSRTHHRGVAVEVTLGASTLVLAPSDAFFFESNEESLDGWRRLLKRLTRVRAPRVVVCLSSSPLETGDQDAAIAWASQLRAHIDRVAAVRGEDVEVTVVLAQAPNAQAGVARGLDPLFDFARHHESRHGEAGSLRFDLSSLAAQIKPGAEQRKESGKAWVDAHVRAYVRHWRKMLVYEEAPVRTLNLAAVVEGFDVISATLGAGLAELFVPDTSKEYGGRGVSLCLVPVFEGKPAGTLAAFGAPQSSADGRWYPSTRVMHRMLVASGSAVLALVLIAGYWHDQVAWDEAATAAIRYNPPGEAQELQGVQSYREHRGHSGDALLLDFFDRELPSCTVVETVRAYLRELVAKEVQAAEAPERVLQLFALYVAGEHPDCVGSDYELGLIDYSALNETIRHEVEQFSFASGLSNQEIVSYLGLACPVAGHELISAADAYQQALRGRGTNSSASWPAVPSAAGFAASLEALSGKCTLSAEERESVRAIRGIQQELSKISANETGSALNLLELFRKLDTRPMKRITDVFGGYADRFKQLADLHDEHADIQRLTNEVLGLGAGAANAQTLKKLAEVLKARISRETSEESPTIRLNLAEETYNIAWRSSYQSVLLVDVDTMVQGFFSAATSLEVSERSREVVFFQPADRAKTHYLPVRQTGDLAPTGVAWRYTAEAYQQGVHEPLSDLQKVFEDIPCARDAEQVSELQAELLLREFVGSRLQEYLHDYLGAWRVIFDSYSFQVPAGFGLKAALAELSSPTSPQLALVREVYNETRFPAHEAFPYSEEVTAAAQVFAPLGPVLEEKVWHGYQALVAELVTAIDAPALPEAPAAPEPAKAGPAEPKAAPSGDAAAEAFAATLSPIGRAVFNGFRDPKLDLLRKAQDWTVEVGLPTHLQRPFLEPFRVAWDLGKRETEQRIAAWWRPLERDASNKILDRFPFRAESAEEASVPDLLAWLHPDDGVLSAQIEPVYGLFRPCAAGSACTSLPTGLSSRIERLRGIRDALFDEQGEAKPLVVRLSPVPFVPQQLFPKRAVLKIGEERHEYFNVRPKEHALKVVWNDAYESSIEVELAGSGADEFPPLPKRAEASPWSFFRLLKQAESANDGEYIWAFETVAANEGSRQVRVSYRVCEDVKRCEGLLTKVFAWAK